MKLILELIAAILVLGLFLYSKLLPYKDKLDKKYKRIFDLFDTIFKPILDFLRTLVKPTSVGHGLAVDMTQIILLIVFLALLMI